MPIKFIDFLRALTFGGLVGIGLAGFIYPHLPDHYHALVTINQFVIFGGFLGGSIHQLIETLIKYAVLPTTRTVLFYEQMLELALLEKAGRIDPDQRKVLQNKLTEIRFLGKPASQQPEQLQLPSRKD